MAIIKSGNTIISFAEYQDVEDMDQRMFEENEGLTDDVVEDRLIRSTERILAQFKNSNWYRELAFSQGATALTIPDLDPNRIIGHANDFRDLTVYYALMEYILPMIADFGTEENAERVKIGFYREKYSAMFDELIAQGNWYDYSGNGTVTADEFRPYPVNYQRVR